MRYFLSKISVLKSLESPTLYQTGTDELYELDEDSLNFFGHCSSGNGCEAEETEFIKYCLREGILTTENISVTRPPLMKSSVPSLRYLELQITDRCNLRCRHCYLGDGGFHELSVKRIENVLRQFEEMQGLRVLITGGEPLVHSGFAEINAILPDFFVRKVLFTNGLLLHEKTLERLNVDEIQISIDGLEDAHDSLRGKGTFSAAIERIKLSLAHGFDVSVSTMVHAKNLGDFGEMERVFKDLGIKDWTVDVPCITGRLRDNAQFQVSPLEAGRYLGYGYGTGYHAGTTGFACGLHLMSVAADGRVSKCTFYADRSAGSIEEGLMESWRKIKPLRLDELSCDCTYKESCRGGCRYRAEILGDPRGKDLYRCALYDILD